MTDLAKSWFRILALLGIIFSIVIIIYLLEYFNILTITNNYLKYLFDICVYLLMLGITCIFVFKYSSFKKVGLHTNQLYLNIGVGVLGSSGFLIAALIFQVNPIYGFDELIILIVVVILVGITEELIFRGFIQSSLTQHYRSFVAIIITAFSFACLHLPRTIFQIGILGLTGLISYTMLGTIIGYYRKFLNSLVGVIILHAFWDYWLLIFVSIEEIPSTITPDIMAMFNFLATGLGLLFLFLLAGLIISLKLGDYKEILFEDFNKFINNKLDKLNKDLKNIELAIQKFPNRAYLKIMKQLINKFIERIEYIIKIMNVDNVKVMKERYKIENKIHMLLIDYYASRSDARKQTIQTKIRNLEDYLGVKGREQFNLTEEKEDNNYVYY